MTSRKVNPLGASTAAYALFCVTAGGGGAADLHPCAKSSLLMNTGWSLGALGSVLFGLAPAWMWSQDPLARGACRICCANKRGVAVRWSAISPDGRVDVLRCFAVPPLLPPLIWFALTLTACFFLCVQFPSQSVFYARRGSAKGGRTCCPGAWAI